MLLEPTIKTYQIRHLNGDDASDRVDFISCKTSQEALQKAWELVDDHGVEIWCERRFVGRLEPPAH